jgi:hypothetical protein
MSVTSWSRIEPDTSHGDLAPDLEGGVAARLADPLWLLARQWQLGERTGEDAGTPIRADATHVAFPMDRADLGGGLAPIGAEPLEVGVERTPDPADAVLRARGLLYFLDLLAEEGLGTIVPAARQLFADGDALLAAIEAGTLALSLGTGAGEPLERAARAFAAWYRPRAGRTAAAAFVADRLEFAFRAAIHTPEGDLILSAPEHHGGRVDWATFTVERVDAAAPPDVAPALTTVIPVPMSIPGMPVVRFWELDDPRFDPGRVEVGVGDAARALLLELLFAFASDWFLIPAPAPAGSLSRILQLAVTDTFGVTTLVPAADDTLADRRFGLWHVVAPGPAGGRPGVLDGLLLASTLADGFDGPPLEEVALVRDQDANVAWAIARIVPDSRGQARPGLQAGTRVELPAPPPTPTAPLQEAPLAYRAMRFPAAGFVPLVLVEGTERMLVRATRIDGLEPEPGGRIIATRFALHDEELPPEGLLVSRRFEMTRSRDGTRHLWIARTKMPGVTVPASGLAFDRLEPKTS